MAQEHRAEGDQDSRGQEQVLGLVADPDMPTQVGARLSEGVTRWLEERTGLDWVVEVVSEPVAAGESSSERILEGVRRYREQRGWRFAVYLTDLPLLPPGGPLVADVSTRWHAALISVPALGSVLPYRRMRRVLTQVVADLLRGEQEEPDQEQPGRWLAGRTSPVRRSGSTDTRVDVRYTGTRVRGWWRLVTGMVFTNRPWRLLWGLSSALAAALAAAGFGLFTSTVWQVGDVLSPWRAAATSVFAVALMTTWLIASHGLWERIGGSGGAGRRVALLYNTSTIATLVVGVGLLYVTVYAVSFVAALNLLDQQVLASTLGHPSSIGTYARLAWMVASMALIAGALGSGLESDAAVRQAAYGYRERQRRKRKAEEKEAAEDTQRGAAD
ncbi:5,10-methylene-tetrahydrofolate dehydrogenase [Saccharopolyspora cebuensis]|uniref:5,10-methylene-tetrahydrofolate dehydrogenase n=1 Tax=Saccharopolyspora cebuensis TaxID=418759 RepID=A0ABV4CJD8_9PSEU